MKRSGKIERLTQLVFRQTGTVFDIYLQPSTVFGGTTFQFPSAVGGTPTLLSDDSLATITNKTFDPAEPGNFLKLPNASVFVGNASGNAIGLSISGDISISNAGVVAISSGVIVNADINASAAIDFSKLAALTSGNILVGSAGNIATSTAVSGDISLSNAGVAAISSGVIIDADVNASAAIALSKLAAVTASKVLVSDGSGFVSASSLAIGDLALNTLANLGTVAINTTLVSDTNNTDDLGTSGIGWKEGFINKISMDSNSQTTSIQGSASASATVAYSLPPADGTSGYVLSTNGSAAMTWKREGYATYSPTITAGTNVSSASLISARYFVNGNVVHVTGRLNVTTSAAAQSSLAVSLPIASNFGASTDADGTCGWYAANGTGAGAVSGDSGNDRVNMDFYVTNNAAGTMGFSFMYEII